MARVRSESASDWESLPPEILASVLQRVLEAGSVQRGEGRRIVAVAGVCRSWRQLLLQQQQQEESAVQKSVTCCGSSLIRFPAAIRRQAAADCPLQCVLKKKGNSFFFFQSCRSVDIGAVDQEYFLLSARKRYMPSCSSFEISMVIKSLVKERAASGCVGSVRSNLSRSAFVLLQYKEAPALGKSPLRVKCSEEIVAGARHRKLSCGLKPVSNSGTSATRCRRPRAIFSVPSPNATSAATRRSFFAWSYVLNQRRQARRVQSALKDEEGDREESRATGLYYGEAGLREKQQDLVEPEAEEVGLWRAVEEATRISLSLKSKPPEWNQETRYWSLDFKGRATMAPIHNFQLIFSSDSTSSNAASSPDDDQTVVLQLGKVGKGIYLAAVYSPLSALDAFSICLTSFATNVGLEP